MRIAVLFDKIGPYHRARLEAATSRMDVIAVEARKRSFIYDWDEASTAPTGLRMIRLTEAEERCSLAWGAITRAFDRKLCGLELDVVAVPGWSGVPAIAMLAWAGRHGIPTIVLSDSTAFDFSRRRFVETTKRHLASFFAAGLAGGDMQKSYLVELGLRPDAVSLGYDAVDNGHFSTGADSVRRTRTMHKDLSAALDQQHFGRFFLCAARMVEKKNLIRLVEAYARYDAEGATGEPWPLVILGSGPVRPALEVCIARHVLSNAVLLPGFAQYEELPAWYGAAGCFILPSLREQWGLVVNEAMASGLPVLVSNRCGCATTLVQEDVNGWTFDPFDVEGMAKAMARVANADEGKRAAFGDASRRIIADWGVDRFVDGLETAAQFAINVGPQPVGLASRLVLRAIAAVQERRSVAGVE